MAGHWTEQQIGLDVQRCPLNFRDMDENGLVLARADSVEIELREGLALVASDGEGNRCVVRVARIDGPNVYLAPDWDHLLSQPSRWPGG